MPCDYTVRTIDYTARTIGPASAPMGYLSEITKLTAVC